MSNIVHTSMVKALVKSGEIINNELTASDCNLLHMAIGICGEAGELIDAVKKAVIYRKDLDITNVIEELGDIEFYMEGIRQEIGVTRSECLDANIEKLAERYNNFVYSDESAINRTDKS